MREPQPSTDGVHIGAIARTPAVPWNVKNRLWQLLRQCNKRLQCGCRVENRSQVGSRLEIKVSRPLQECKCEFRKLSNTMSSLLNYSSLHLFSFEFVNMGYVCVWVCMAMCIQSSEKSIGYPLLAFSDLSL